MELEDALLILIGLRQIVNDPHISTHKKIAAISFFFENEKIFDAIEIALKLMMARKEIT